MNRAGLGGQRATTPPLLGARTVARAGSTHVSCALPTDSSALRHLCSAAEPRAPGCAPPWLRTTWLTAEERRDPLSVHAGTSAAVKRNPSGYGGSGRSTAEFVSRRAGDLGTSQRKTDVASERRVPVSASSVRTCLVSGGRRVRVGILDKRLAHVEQSPRIDEAPRDRRT